MSGGTTSALVLEAYRAAEHAAQFAAAVKRVAARGADPDNDRVGSPVHADRDLLDRIERYLDAVPRSSAPVEPFGSLTLFTRRGAGWPYYARPTLGWTGPVRAGDLAAVRDRQRELGLPEALEWVDETTPSLRPLAAQQGWRVEALPLMVLTSAIVAPTPEGASVRLLDADDPQVAAATAVAEVGFGFSGTAAGTAGPAERDRAAARIPPERLAMIRDRLRSRLTVTAVAEQLDAGPVSVGSHQPVDGVTEIVGVATLPVARRRGLGAAVTARLVADAGGSGVSTVFLSAGSDDVARMYARVGFARIGTFCSAEPVSR